MSNLGILLSILGLVAFAITRFVKAMRESRESKSDFRKGLLWAAIPIILLSVAGEMIGGMGGHPEVGTFFWWGAAIYWAGALVTAIVFAVKGRKAMAFGILFVLTIGVGLVVASIAGFYFHDATPSRGNSGITATTSNRVDLTQQKKEGMSDFRKALLWTAIPALSVAIVAAERLFFREGVL